MSWTPMRSDGAACPACGAPRPRADDQVDADEARRRLTTLVRMTHDLLDVELAMLTEIADGREHARVHAGDWPELGPLPGASLPLGDTICHLVLEGRIGHAVADARADEWVRELPAVRDLGVGAYLGVPIQVSEAELYVLCCLAREARPGLGTREVRLLSGLAESVRAELAPRTPRPVG